MVATHPAHTHMWRHIPARFPNLQTSLCNGVITLWSPQTGGLRMVEQVVRRQLVVCVLGNCQHAIVLSTVRLVVCRQHHAPHGVACERCQLGLAPQLGKLWCMMAPPC